MAPRLGDELSRASGALVPCNCDLSNMTNEPAGNLDIKAATLRRVEAAYPFASSTSLAMRSGPCSGWSTARIEAPLMVVAVSLVGRARMARNGP